AHEVTSADRLRDRRFHRIVRADRSRCEIDVRRAAEEAARQEQDREGETGERRGRGPQAVAAFLRIGRANPRDEDEDPGERGRERDRPEPEVEPLDATRLHRSERGGERRREVRPAEAALRVRHPRQEERDERDESADERDGASEAEGTVHEDLPGGEFADTVAGETTWPAPPQAASNEVR